ncbi:MAG TPA: kelch repeat-containing protein [Gemmatimonadales bacterium]|nr:kelch repeat-containing protein [Gemmatimonadales bacterium]
MFDCSWIRAATVGMGALVLAACNEPTSPIESTAEEIARPELATAAANTWLTKADMPGTARGGLSTAAITTSGRTILYAIGGRTTSGGSLGRVQAYNVATNSWTWRASMPMAAYDMNGAGVINGRIYVSGGVTRDKFFRRELYMYNPATNAWTRKRDLPDGTWGGTTEVLKNQLYVLTCLAQEDCYIDFRPLSLFRYDPATDQWTQLASPPPQFGRPMSGTIGGKLYVTGVARDASGILSVYDPATNQWSSRTGPARGVYEGAGVAVDGKLYLFGGRERQPDWNSFRVRTTRVYDPATDSWSTRAPMPDLRSGYAASRVLLNGERRVQVVGGPVPGNNRQYIP